MGILSSLRNEEKARPRACRSWSRSSASRNSWISGLPKAERAGYTIRTGSCRARLVTFGEGEATSSTPAKCSEPMIWLQKRAP
jgi:hypothetical protein